MGFGNFIWGFHIDSNGKMIIWMGKVRIYPKNEIGGNRVIQRSAATKNLFRNFFRILVFLFSF